MHDMSDMSLMQVPRAPHPADAAQVVAGGPRRGTDGRERDGGGGQDGAQAQHGAQVIDI